VIRLTNPPRDDVDSRNHWASLWWPRVYRMALAMTGNPADAEDLAQETLISALSAAERFRGESSESTWLYSILLHKTRRRKARSVARLPVPSDSRDVDEASLLLAALPVAQRITAALYYVEDMTVREIACALGVPQVTVRWRLFRARKRLRESLIARRRHE